MGVCPRLDDCGFAGGCGELKEDFRYGFWLKSYCLSESGCRSCSRFDVFTRENRQPPANLTPSGELLAVPLNLETMRWSE